MEEVALALFHNETFVYSINTCDNPKKYDN